MGKRNEEIICTNQDVLNMYNQIWSAGVEMGYFTPEQKPPLYLQKSTRRYGCCYNQIVGKRPYPYSGYIMEVSKIVIHPGCIQHPDFCKETLVHEIVHAAHAIKYGESGHNYLFYAIGNKFGEKFNCAVTRTASDIYNILKRNEYYKNCYMLVCSDCGKKYGPKYRLTETMQFTESLEGYKCSCGSRKLHWIKQPNPKIKEEQK